MTDVENGAGPVPTTGYAPVDGLRTHDEVHGGDLQPDRDPVLVLHGAYMTAGDFGEVLPTERF